MFQEKRHVTKGVVAEIPLETQIFIWGLIDDLLFKSKVSDYLQIFDLDIRNESESQRFQTITHRQEQPKYKRNYIIQTSKPVRTKIYVIDDVTHCTMLLAEEY